MCVGEVFCVEMRRDSGLCKESAPVREESPACSGGGKNEQARLFSTGTLSLTDYTAHPNTLTIRNTVL